MAEREMKKGTYTVRNIAPGPRGFHDAETGYAELDAGQSATGVRFHTSEFDAAVASKYFEITAGDAPAADQDDGTETPSGAKAYDDTTVADIKSHLDTAGVSYETDANKKALYALYTATFEQDNPGGTGDVTPPPGDTLDKMSDADLRDTVKALTGEEPAADADRETLLKLARGEE